MSQYSDTSDFNDLPTTLSDISSDNNNTLLRGGFLGFGLAGNDSTHKAALKMAKEGNWSGLKTLVECNAITNYAAKDAQGNTVLHYVLSDLNEERQRLGKLIIEKGGKGLELIQNFSEQLPGKVSRLGENLKQRVADSDNFNTEVVTSIIKGLVVRGDKNNTSSPQLTEQPDKFLMISQISPNNGPSEVEQKQVPSNINNIFGKQEGSASPSRNTTDELVELLKNKIANDSPNAVQRGGDTTEDLINIITYQSGGGKKNTRKLNTYSEFSPTEGSSDNLSRLIQNQATDIHNQAVKDIEAILKKNKVKYDDINLAARAIKAELWTIVKEKFASLSNLDKAHELKKMITEENVVNAKNVKNMMKVISERDSEREQRTKNTTSETPSEKPKKAEKAEKTEKAKKTKTADSSDAPTKKKTTKQARSKRHGGYSDSLSDTSDEKVKKYNYSVTSMDNNQTESEFSITSINSYY